jgi:hypothetical protein
MPADFLRIRRCLKQFDFDRLFIEELGWDRHVATLEISVGTHTHTLTAIAQKRGMVAFLCPASAVGRMVDHATRRSIDRLVSKSHFEHLIVFIDTGKTTQIWQWVKREPSRPAASREHVWHKSQPGDALVQKLDRIAFALEEEEAIGGISDVVGRVRAGFDLEHVTKRFYERFKAEHDTFAVFLKGIPDDDMHRWYVSVMLNRLMFIYFVQKKGFLAGDQDYLRNKLSEVRQAGKDRFYAQFLCPLFFEGFAAREQDRPAAVNQLLGSVPYLNGGLFMRHQVEELHGHRIQIADAAFEKVFAFFDAYHWHLDERPLRRDDEINPDVLGYIFEKYINQKQMGAYYTKEDITEYISKNVVIPFLFDAAKADCPIAFKPESFLWRLLREDPDRYIYGKDKHGHNTALKKGVIDDAGAIIPLPPDIEAGIADVAKRTGWNRPADAIYALPTETWREHVARRQRCLDLRRKLIAGEVHEINELITLNLDIRQFAQDVIDNAEGLELLRAFYEAIVKVTVLDPTCGSGAFLFAALGILEPLYEACIDRMDGFLSPSPGETALGGRQGSSVRETYLAGHGQTVAAVKFADFRAIRDRIDKHPNERYFILKSIIVNNLFGVDIMEEAVEICKLRLFLKLVAQVQRVDQIEPLPDIDFNIRAGNTLVGYTTFDEVKKACDYGQLDFEGAAVGIAAKAQAVEQQFANFRERQLAAGRETSSALTRSIKQAILTPLNELRAELDQQLANHSDIKGAKGFAEWRKSHQPFHWFIEFYGIMKEGGFDVVIGNPPWAEYAKVKNHYQVRGYSTEKCGNLHGICTERSLRLRNRLGRLSFIVQLPLVSSSRMAPVREALRLKSSTLHVIPFDDRPGKLFEGLQHCRSVIFFAGPEEARDQVAVFTTRYQRWPTETRQHLFNGISFTRIQSSSLFPSMFPKFESSSFDTLFRRIHSGGGSTIGAVATSRKTEHFIFYQEATQYWVKATVGLPFYAKNGEVGPPAHGRYLYFADETRAHAMCAILNSSLFYAYFIAYSDCFHLSDTLACAFPVAEVLISNRPLADANRRLLKELVENSERKVIRTSDGNEICYAEYFVSKSKPSLDVIDQIIARSFGFDETETDAIVNFDVKYRMGVEEPETESADLQQVFPATARDRQLCSMFLELVKNLPGLAMADYLDGLVLAVNVVLCKKALIDASDRKQYQQLAKKHHLEMLESANAAIPWDVLQKALVAMEAAEIGDTAGTIRAGAKWLEVRDSLGALPSGLVALVIKGLKNVTDNAADLVGVDDLKRSIRSAATAMATG